MLDAARSIPTAMSVASRLDLLEKLLEGVPGAADQGCAVGEQQVVEFAFAQVLLKSLAEAVPDAFRVVTHVFIRHEAEFSAITHDRVADTQNAAVHRQIQGGFLGAQRRDLQRQDASRQFLAVGETPYLLAVAEFVQAILVAPDFCAVALGEAAAVPVVMAVGEI